MPRLPILLSTSLCLLVGGCGLFDLSASADYDFVEERGTLKLLFPHADEPQYAVYPASMPHMRFCVGASALAEASQWDGAPVVFTGDRLPIPSDVLMACAPLDLVEIRATPRFGRRSGGR